MQGISPFSRVKEAIGVDNEDIKMHTLNLVKIGILLKTNSKVKKIISFIQN
jgi:hypothetical protein